MSEENINMPNEADTAPAAEASAEATDGSAVITAADKPSAPSKLPPWLARIAAPFEGMNHMWLALLLPMFIMALIYFAMQVWPSGENSVLVLDLNGQYVYYFEAIRDFFLGEQGILYSFERALGGEFLGIVAYYLASPFSFIVALFPEGMITESLYVILLLKCGLSGMNMCVYLHKSHPTKPVNEVIFSAMYALTSYGVVMQHNTMWFDCVLFFPLIMLGIESLIKEGKYKLFTVTLAVALLSNYYIGYMVCIGVAAYFFFYYFSCTKEERNPLGKNHHFLRTLGKMALFSAIAVGIAAVIILPAYYSLQFGKNEFSNPDYTFSQKFDFLDLISKMYPASYDTVRPAGWPFVYSGLLTLIFLPIFFMSNKIATRKKVAYGILSGFFVLSFASTTIDLVWHGFQKPNWLNYRYSFMFCFVIIVMAYLVFEHLDKLDMRKVYGVGIMLGLLIVILQKLEYDNIKDLTTVWITVGFIFLYMILISGCSKSRMNGSVSTLLCIAVMLELFANGMCEIVSLDSDVHYSSRTGYRDFQYKWTPVADWMNENDKGFYRAEKTTHRKTNDNFLLNLKGLSNSTSTLNAKQIKFLNQMGYSSKSHWSKYLGGTPVSDSLLGIKYMLANTDDSLNRLWGEPVYTDTKNSTAVYKNECALPIGYTVSSDVSEIDLEVYASPFIRMNTLISEMMGDTETVQVFKPYAGITPETENITSSYIAGHRKYKKTSSEYSGKVTYSFTAKNDYEIFVYFPSDYPRDVDLSLNGEELSEFYTNETFRIVSLGHHETGEEIHVSMTLLADEVYIDGGSPYFFYLDEEVFRQVMPRLAEGGFNVTEHTDSMLKGTVTAFENKTQLFLTIPYDEGWKVYVDGVEAETYEVLGALTAVDLEPGEHSVEMKYRPWCVSVGCTVAGASALLLTAIIVTEQILKKRKAKVSN